MSRFVAAGENPDSLAPPADERWLKAQQTVEALRKPKRVEEGKQEGGKSLYEVLQANKGRQCIVIRRCRHKLSLLTR
jgi:hypothetical protein